MVNRKNRRSLLPWHQRLAAALLGNLQMTLAGMILLIIASVLLCSRGCGSGGNSPEREPAANTKPPSSKPVTATLTVARSADTSSEAEQPPAATEQPPAVAKAEPTTKVTPKAAVRPGDLADWKEEDYQSALRDADPRLPAALGYYGEHFAGDEDAAEFLAKFLELSDAEPAASVVTQAAAMMQGPGSVSSRKRIPNLTETVIAALDINGTPRARQTIESALATAVDGTRKTGNKRQVAAAALKVLAARPGPGTEELFLRIIAAPEQTTTRNAVSDDSTKFQTTALEAVHTDASESLSVRLAEWMIATKMSKTLRDQISDSLKEIRPENLIAQIMLYQSDRPSRATHEWLEHATAAYSSGGLGRLLGIPPPEHQDTALTKTIAAMDVYRLAERLWAPEMAEVLDRRLAELSTLEEGAPLVTLASTIPNPTVRASLLRTLARHWDETPSSLTLLRAVEGTRNSGPQAASVGGFQMWSGAGPPVSTGGPHAACSQLGESGKMDVIVEPGFVALVKMLRRDDRPESATGKNTAARSGSRDSATARPPKKLADLQEDKKRREQVGQQWMDFSRTVVQSTCRRLCAAARAKQVAGNGTNSTPDDLDLPFELHPGAQLSQTYRLDWPEDVGTAMAAAPILKVRYVRIEQRAVPRKVLAYYRRRASNFKEHGLASGSWIDSINIDREQGRTRSIDVLVAKANTTVLGPPDQEQEITVDLLIVECEGISKPTPVSSDRRDER